MKTAESLSIRNMMLGLSIVIVCLGNPCSAQIKGIAESRNQTDFREYRQSREKFKFDPSSMLTGDEEWYKEVTTQELISGLEKEEDLSFYLRTAWELVKRNVKTKENDLLSKTLKKYSNEWFNEMLGQQTSVNVPKEWLDLVSVAMQPNQSLPSVLLQLAHSIDTSDTRIACQINDEFLTITGTNKQNESSWSKRIKLIPVTMIHIGGGWEEKGTYVHLASTEKANLAFLYFATNSYLGILTFDAKEGQILSVLYFR